MALCCIGGVCVPYTAVLPLVALALKWMLGQLVAAGLMPRAWLDKLGVSIPTTASTSTDCCAAATTVVVDDDMPHVTDAAAWEALWKNHSNQTVVVAKMTAQWCKPCQHIQPTFAQYAATYHDKDKDDNKKKHVTFCTVDVDGCDTVAAAYHVSMMPTFLILQGDDRVVVDRYAGSHAGELTAFLAKHLK